MKKLLSVLLASAVLTTTVVPALAASDEAVKAANELYSQGLFNGTGKDTNGNPNFELDRAPTRAEAVTMLVRLLGKDSEARNGSWDTPFTDVEDWAKPFIRTLWIKIFVRFEANIAVQLQITVTCMRIRTQRGKNVF